MKSSHILILPMPFQGHIIPLMEMAHHLIDVGFTVTFVNTDFNHHRLLSATTNFSTTTRLHLVGIPDGMSSDDDRKDVGLVCKLIQSGMSPGLHSIIRAAALEGRPIQWMLADQVMAWALPSAKQMGLRCAVFSTFSAAMLAIFLNIPKLIQIGVIDEDGFKKKDEIFELAAGMPVFRSTQLAWNLAGKSADIYATFSFITNNNRATEDYADFIICNTFMDLEPHALSLLPTAIPVGPLLPVDHHPVGHLWPAANSSSIFKWLDSHEKKSVIYIAFGSITIFDKAQVDELAHGLEETGRPFLWAFRPDVTSMGRDQFFTEEFMRRVEDRALIVGWAPQQEVLAHPSIGCFLSHCGWNSTLEGVWNGVRFVCWPYFGDQFLNQSYICEIYRTGVSMGPKPDEDENGNEFISWERIRERVEEVMRDDEMRERALMWKERSLKSVNLGGSSSKNLERLIDIIKNTT